MRTVQQLMESRKLPVILFFNHKEYKLDSYNELLGEDSAVWQNIQDTCGWAGTGGDWRDFSRIVDELFHSEVCQSKQIGKWASYYQPYRAPAIAIKFA